MNLKQHRSPCCDSEDQRSTVNNTLNEFNQNQQTLMTQMLSDLNIGTAWQHVKSNKGAPGIDNMKIDEFNAFAVQHWQGIKSKILDETYQPLPVKRVRILKSDGGERLLGIPSVIDRMIQQAISQVITPYFEPLFSSHSYGYRPGKRASQAVSYVQSCVKQGFKTAVDIDLSKFFDEVNHDMLMNRIGRKIKDKSLMRLLGKYLRAGIAEVETGLWFASDKGVPQGGPLSPLLSNILLDELDKKLSNEQLKFARYADDIIILVKTKSKGTQVKKDISHYITKRLKLIVNEFKSRVGPVSGSKFLGFTFRYAQVKIHDNALKLFKEKVRKLTNRNWGISMTLQIHKLTQFLRGWGYYFLIANVYQLAVDLDAWIRRRLRMCYWRQWRKPRTKVRSLIKLGVSEYLAISCGITSTKSRRFRRRTL
ncbi:group II intron reverse transcriptase/maturase [Pseudoalteromonas sp. '520P1 No. 423']|uniref:group II intron reverse transcriptase/maturase n=2 Tax=unclassified Pseudoalteromonas TaxID=194690 RepID=UPI000A580571|nr:group II intron reverse transcriptase/maturase [Pseudoalteromonas sp. '520P1 No. 423']